MFNLDHVFVAFAQGSGGNFVTAVMKKIVNGDLTHLPINRYGSYHILDSGKRENKDSIAFGTVAEENEHFSSIEEKEKYYIEQIKKEYTEPKRIITWTHDFTNLPSYKKHFPNCRILSITTYTPEEKLMSILMQVNKVFLADEKNIPISLDLWEWFKHRLSYHLGLQLKEILGDDIDAEEIFKNRMSDEYNDLFFYISVRILLVYANLIDLFKIIDEEPPNLKYLNFKKTKINYPKLINENSDALLPFSHLPENNSNIFKKAYSDTLNRKLTSAEGIFLEESLEDYYNRQDDFLIDDPIGYFKYRKKRAFSKINISRAK